MIKKKTVVKYLEAVKEFCSSRDCDPKKCPLCTGLCYPDNCMLNGLQPNRWEISHQKGSTDNG